MRNSCFTRPTNPCPLGVINAKCIIYTGANLTNISVLTNDRLDVILQKINDAIETGSGTSLFISAGTGINITGAGTSGNPKVISSTITQYNDEQAQDAVGNILTSSGSITFTYNDFGPSISANITDSYFDSRYFRQGGNSFSAIARLGTNDSFPLEFETVNIKRGEIDTSGRLLINTTASGSSKLQVGGDVRVSANTGLKSSNAPQTLTIGDDSTGVNTIFIYAPSNSAAFIESSPGTSINIQSGSNITLFPDGDGRIIIDSPTNYISEAFYAADGIKYGEVGLGSLGGGINEFYIKPFNSAEITLYDKVRFINTPQDDSTTKLLAIDSSNRVRWHESTLFAPYIGSPNYIQNQFTGPQSTSNWWVSGNGRVNGYLQVNNAARMVTDSSGKMMVSPSTSSTLGGELRVGKLWFADQSIPNNNSLSYIYAQQQDFLNLHSPFNLILDAPQLALTQHTKLNMGGSFPLIMFGSQSDSLYPGPTETFLDLFNDGPANTDSSSVGNFLTFSLNRTVGPSNRIQTYYARVGARITDAGSTTYKGGVSIQTADGALPVERIYIDFEGKTSLTNIPHETTDVDKFVVWSPDGILRYRTGAELLSDIGGGSGGGGLTSVGISSTDLSVSGSPLTSNGSITLNINNDAVTYAKMQNVSAASRLLGRGDSGSGDPQEITIGSGLQMVGTTLSATVGGGTPTLQQVLTSGSTLTGANTINAGGFNFTLNNNAIITLGTSAAQIILDASGQDLTIASTDKFFLKTAGFGSATVGDVLSITNTTTGETAWVANGVGSGGSVTNFTAGNLSPLFTSNVATATSTPALTFSLTNAGAHTYFGNNTGSSAAPSYITGGALTKTDDTNITLTLGGTPGNALLDAVSLTLGWTGTLAITRGGTGLSALGTAGQLPRVNAGATALEYFTAPYLLSLNGLTTTAQTFATGTSGSDFNINSTTSTHTFNIPDASVSARGLVTTGSQTFIGTKNFNGSFMANTSGGDNDCRISGDSFTNLIYTDASADKVGINTNTPLALLHVTKGVNNYSGADQPVVYIDSGSSNRVGMELKGSADINGLIISNTGPSNVVFLQFYNEGNNKAFTHTLDIDNSYSIRENDALGGVSRIKIAPSTGDISLTGNLYLNNKIDGYNNTAITNGQVLLGHTANGTFEKGLIAGTSNQIIATVGAGTLTLSLPQDIHTGARPQWTGVGVGTAGAATAGIILAGSYTTNAFTFSNPTVNAIANSSPSILSIGGTIAEASSGVHALETTVSITAAIVTSGVATATNAATLYIAGAMTTTVTGHSDALWVASGTSRFDGDVVASAPNYSSGGYDVMVRNQSTGRVEKTTISAGVVVVTSSASTLTLASPNTDYIFTGTTTTWTLPAVSGNTGVKFFIKNRGSGNITLQRAGSDQIYDNSAVTSITILPGEWTFITNDGSFWNS